MWFGFFLLLFFTPGKGSRIQEKKICRYVIAISTYSRFQDMEAGRNSLDHSLYYQYQKNLATAAPPPLHILFTVLEAVYEEGLRRRIKSMERESLADFLFYYSDNHLLDYMEEMRARRAPRGNFFKISHTKHLLDLIRPGAKTNEELFAPFLADRIDTEILNGAYMTLMTFSEIYMEYREYLNLPLAVIHGKSMDAMVDALTQFLESRRQYDFASSFPDFILSILLVNYFRYCAWLHGLFFPLVEKLDNCLEIIYGKISQPDFYPNLQHVVYEWSMGVKIDIMVMPQEKAGSIIVPAQIFPDSHRPLVQVGEKHPAILSKNFKSFLIKLGPDLFPPKY